MNGGWDATPILPTVHMTAGSGSEALTLMSYPGKPLPKAWAGCGPAITAKATAKGACSRDRRIAARPATSWAEEHAWACALHMCWANVRIATDLQAWMMLEWQQAWMRLGMLGKPGCAAARVPCYEQLL